MNNLFLEKNQVKQGLLLDLNGENRTTARVSIEKSQRIACIVSLASAAADFTIAFQQHILAAAGTPANLEIKLPYFKKIDDDTAFTKVAAPSSTAHTVTDDDANGAVAYYVFEFDADQLAEGRKYISATITDPAAARLANVQFIAYGDNIAPMYDKVV